MYTGIVDHVGHIVTIEDSEQMRRLSIQTQFKDFERGESIAVDGICLTVTDYDQHGVFYCDLSPETMRTTKASEYQVGQAINLERSLRVGDRIGGHFVSGHVDAMARIVSMTQQEGCCHVVVGGIAASDMPLLLHKGSVAVDGVSLTINALREDGFELMLIPQTLELTQLKDCQVGDAVHIEFDQLAKCVARQLQEVSHVA